MQKTTRILVEGAMMIAVASVLSLWKIVDMPFGGSITLEMLPLVLMAYRNGTKWGCFTGFVHGIIQMILGFSNVMYCATLLSQIGCILLDYVLAFTALGLAPVVANLFKNNKVVGYVVGSIFVGVLRFVCSFLSGALLWGAYAPEEMGVWKYSLLYNGAYMLPNTIILAVVMGLLVGVAPKLFHAEN